MTGRSDDRVSAAVEVSDEMAAHFRDTLSSHADDALTGVCIRCGRSRCDEWRWAYERLVLAGRLDDLPKAPGRGDGDPPKASGRGDGAGATEGLAR